MDTEVGMLLTSGQVARELSTTVPRVLRAVRGGGIPTVRRGNRFLFDAAGVKALRQRLGATPRIPGLTREDVLVLAALGRRPFGLGSVRAVARASGVSPTTAGRSLRRLVDQGYVARETVRVAEGKARDVTVWTVRWAAPSWLRVAAKAGQVLLPAESPAPARASGRGLPARLGHLFWNETPQSLDLDRHADLVADRILRSNDPEAHAWMLQRLPEKAILQATRTRGLDPRRARLGRLLAHET
jgi:DNA-binding MarR family transcriptional regulator